MSYKLAVAIENFVPLNEQQRNSKAVIVMEIARLEAEQTPPDFPEVVCLCGEIPCTREEFEAREAAEKAKESTHA